MSNNIPEEIVIKVVKYNSSSQDSVESSDVDCSPEIIGEEQAEVIDPVESVLRNAYHFFDICDELENSSGKITDFKRKYIQILLENIFIIMDYSAPVKFLEVNKKSITPEIYTPEVFPEIFVQSYLYALKYIENLPEGIGFFNFSNEMEIYGLFQTLSGGRGFKSESYFDFMEFLVNSINEIPYEFFLENANFNKEELLFLKNNISDFGLFYLEGAKIQEIMLESTSSRSSELFKNIYKLNNKIEEIILNIVAEKLTMSAKMTKTLFKQSELDKINEEDRLDYTIRDKIMMNNDKIVVSNDSILKKLDSLRERFPIFEKFLDFVENESVLNDIGSGLFQLPPSLIHGEPGIGKTFFLNEFAQAVNVSNAFFNMGAVTSGLEFSGVNPTFQDANIGRMLNQMLDAKMINPIFILDEIDKLVKTNYPIMPVLLPLLEKHTAESFKDEFIAIPCDLSHVTWLSTANDIELISKPLLSRMHTFDIPNPNFEQRKIFAKQIYSKICQSRKLENKFSKELNEEFLSVLCEEDNSSRDLGKNLTICLARASKRNDVKENMILIPEDFKKNSVQKKKGIGFVN